MKNLKEIVEDEIFVEDLKIDRDSDDLSTLQTVTTSMEKLPFEVNGIKYQVFFQSTTNDVGTTVSAAFRNVTEIEKIRDKKKVFSSPDSTMDAINAAKHGITGTGSAFAVFRKVYNIVGKYIEKKQPTYFKYQAIEDNRKRLYLKIVEHIQKELPIKFTPSQIDPDTGVENLDKDTFVFKISYH